MTLPMEANTVYEHTAFTAPVVVAEEHDVEGDLSFRVYAAHPRNSAKLFHSRTEHPSTIFLCISYPPAPRGGSRWVGPPTCHGGGF